MTAPTVAVQVPATQPLMRPRRHRLHTTIQQLLPQASCRLGCDLTAGLYTPAAMTAADHARTTGHTTVVTQASSTVYRPEVRR